MRTGPLRVVIADDSSFFREVLREVLEADGDIHVVAEAADGLEAVRAVEKFAPDLLTLDLRMPGLDGLTVVEELMAARPTPILVLTAQPSGPGNALVFEATRRGALDVWEKRQVGRDWEGGAGLRTHVRQLARVRVVHHSRRSTPPPASGASTPGPARALPPAPLLAGHRPRVVGIGASAGGPPALAAILGALPVGFAACVAVVQHIPVGFAGSFASFIRGCTALKVVSVTQRTPVTPGTVLLPADDRHLMAVGPDAFEPGNGPPERGHRPSVDALFFSLAHTFGADATGVLLTGMGDDGARGLAAMKARGAYTMAQDESTSVVWGMPRAALELEAVDRTLPLSTITSALVGAARP